jgi:FG-GAP-like repeat
MQAMTPSTSSAGSGPQHEARPRFYFAVQSALISLVILLLARSAFAVIADSSFTANFIGLELATTASHEGSGIAFGDMNGDGIQDLVTSPRGLGRVEIRIGRGDGTFAEPLNFLTDLADGLVSVEDLDDDGLVDVVVADITRISWLRGLGSGYLAHPRACVAYAETPPNTLLLADLNHDGRTDYFLTTHTRIVTRLGLGGGVVDSATILHVSTPIVAAALAHLNGDSFLDAVVATGEGSPVMVLLGDGLGAFGPATTIGPGGASIAVDDLDRDGRVDVVSGRQVYRAQPGGGFVLSATLSDNALSSVDVTQDGRLDLVGFRGDSLVVFAGHGDATFEPRHAFATTTDPSDLAVADVDGDSASDILVSPRSHSMSALHRGLGASMFPSIKSFSTGGAAFASVLADVNDDLVPDLLTANDSLGVAIMLGVGDGTLEAPNILSAGAGVRDLVLADFDGDGRRDLATANSTANTMTLRRATGPASFAPGVEFGTVTHPMTIAAGDLNEDGHMDAIILGVAGAGCILFGNGSGGFDRRLDFGLDGSKRPRIAVEDLDQDGHLDLLVLSQDSANLWVVRHFPGDGIWNAMPYPSPQVATSPREARDVAVGDLNGDGFLDVVFVGSDSAQYLFQALYDSSYHSFRGGESVRIGPQARDLALADVDGDGHLDAITAAGAGGTMTVYRGDGLEGFWHREEYGVGSSPSSVNVGDMNGDGAPDLVVTQQSSGTACILLNTQASAMAPPVPAISGTMVEADEVRLTWQATGQPGIGARVERHGSDAQWQALGSIVADGSGNLQFADTDVSPDQSYAYRLVMVVNGIERATAETWVTVPRGPELAMSGLTPNPVTTASLLTVSSPLGGRASLNVLDIGGRRIASRDLGTLRAGTQRVELGFAERLAPGVYLACLHFAGRALSTRFVVVR